MSDRMASDRVGAVVIGRNEGDRLHASLASVQRNSVPRVYVDSGSTDGSLEVAKQYGAPALVLDHCRPFTAARARNAGLERLLAEAPGIDYVQFVDGDCELHPGWMASAASFLDTEPDVAVVCGRLRERFPDRSIYNLLCDMEWDGPVGEILACGGIAMMRIEAVLAVGGFREDLIAGEEPELCVRLRRAGWGVWRIDNDMAWHDAAMTSFGQWWRRAERGGHAAAEGAYLHGASPERHGVKQSRSALFWGIGVPLTTLVSLGLFGVWGSLVLLLYALQVVRMAWRGGALNSSSWWHALFLVIGKFPAAIGNLRFQLRRLFGGVPRLIEYK